MEDETEQAKIEHISDVLNHGLKVFVQAPRFALRVQASILGCATGQYVILRSAADKTGTGLSALLPRIGDNLIVRLLVDGIAYAFTSWVILVLSRPESLVFLQYPEAIEQVSVRQHKRLPCRLPCVLIDAAGERSNALLLDISAQGGKVACREVAEEHLESGKPVKLELTFSASTGPNEVEGRIIRMTQQRSVITAGIAFDKPYTALIDSLSGYLCLSHM